MVRTLVLAAFLAASLGGTAMAHPWGWHRYHYYHHHHHHCGWHHRHRVCW
jgi:hypothetical protein